jgi:primosomal protein N' (replication factor Y) (superfamily II helicase)
MPAPSIPASSSAIAQVEPMTTARAMRGPFDYRLPEELRDGVTVGSTLVVPFGPREILGVVTALCDHSEVAEEKLLAPLRALDEGRPTLPIDLVALAEWLAEEYCSTPARALALVLPPAATRRLSGRKRRPAPTRPEHVQVGGRSPRPPELTAEQSSALATLTEALASETTQTRLLAGITGSGKTEVYLGACAEALARGRGAIVLVPEIALTPQIVGRFVERFGDTVAVIHSRLTLAQRREEWRRLRAGEARVCVGPRSAVFAPVERLGLIVVDEEHDSSYKHEGDPRYDARTVAARRARDCSALLLLGSATPRPESIHDATGVLRLSRRVDGRPLPKVAVLDMREQPHGLHPLTAQALAEVRATGGKAIVLLNRRGWSNFLTCRSCGRVWGCPQCDVALVLHRASAVVACHHCGHREPAPRRCECGSSSVARHGAGTERMQHDLIEALDDGSFPVFRLDADTAGGSVSGDGVVRGGRAGEGGAGRDRVGESGVGGDPKNGGVASLLSRFEAAPSGVLIGTQMVAKGHDFPDVTLGVVLDADATLRFPDFRAEERTFALVTQLAGRVGRGGEGRVLVQTMAPGARSILHAAAHDSDGFLAGELQRRQALGYPPYSSLIRVVCSAEQSACARAAAETVRAGLAGSAGSVLGPAGLFRLRGRERQVLVVKSPPESRPTVIRGVGAAVQRVAEGRAHRGVFYSVDVDPQ